MGLTTLAVAIGLLVFIGVFTAASAFSGGLSTVEQRVRQLRKEEKSRPAWQEYLDRSKVVLGQLGEVVPRSPQEMTRVERRLVRAGFRRKESALTFHGTQAALTILFLASFFATGRLQTNLLLYGVLSILLGSALPDFWLARKERGRQERIQLALPDALDLQVVSVEAGIGLDQALMRIGQELKKTHPDLSDELYVYNLEVNAGRSRAEALRNMAARTEVADLKALVAVLIQTDRFGTSIADSLRVFSDSLRTKRRQRAEEMAAKMSVKMVLPLFLCILPATFAVVVGPAIIGIAKGLLPFLKAGGVR